MGAGEGYKGARGRRPDCAGDGESGHPAASTAPGVMEYGYVIEDWTIEDWLIDR